MHALMLRASCAQAREEGSAALLSKNCLSSSDICIRVCSHVLACANARPRDEWKLCRIGKRPCTENTRPCCVSVPTAPSFTPLHCCFHSLFTHLILQLPLLPLFSDPFLLSFPVSFPFHHSRHNFTSAVNNSPALLRSDLLVALSSAAMAQCRDH